MPHDRFFAESSFEKIEDQEFQHLVKVMRAKEGDQVELVNGKGELAKATLTQIEKRCAHLKVNSLHKEEKSKKSLILAQAIPRLNRLDFIIEKGTELGMTEIWLFPSKFSEKKQLTDQQQKRLKLLAISAMKQCGRLFLPEIKIFNKLTDCRFDHLKAFFGDLSKDAPTLAPKDDSSIVFIGPEKGFDDDEILWLKNQNAQGVKLHSNVLRTDTAALVALTLLSK